MNLDTKYAVCNNSIVPVVELENGKYVSVSEIFSLPDKNVFTSKNDALYFQLIEKLGTGTPLNNYKQSKYYNYYIKRLENENPEYLL